MNLLTLIILCLAVALVVVVVEEIQRGRRWRKAFKEAHEERDKWHKQEGTP